MELPNNRKRVSTDDLKEFSPDAKLSRLYHEDIAWQEGVQRRESIVIDTNDVTDNVEYKMVNTTDHYRKGAPYKLFMYPGKSKATVSADIGNVSSITRVALTLNHCRTNCNAIIDIYVNEKPFLTGYKEARWDNFGTQTFMIPKESLQDGINIFDIRLNDASPGVYWLSDLKLDIDRSAEYRYG